MFIARVFIEHLLLPRLFQSPGTQPCKQSTCCHEACVPVVGKEKKEKKSCGKTLSSRR